MTYKVWVRKLTFNLSRGIGWRLAAGLTLGLLLGAVMQVSRAGADPTLAPTHGSPGPKPKDKTALPLRGNLMREKRCARRERRSLCAWQ
jgi:hypothetical protein